MKDAVKALVAGELRALEAQKSNTPETGANARNKAFGEIGGILSMSVRQLITGKSNGRAG